MIEECLFIGSIRNNKNNCKYGHVVIMLMEYLNTHKQDFRKLSHHQYSYDVIDIKDFNYIEPESGEPYYNAMCELELDNKTHSHRMTIEYDIIDKLFRREKINKIKALCQKLV